jgi:hypothetical protein
MAKKKKIYSDTLKDKAINLVKDEKRNWEDSEIFITERVAFRVRDLIRTCYKNYWGVFDKPQDSMTGKDKIWYPLSEEVANTWIDNSDLDTKDIGFRTRPGGNYAITQLTRQIMKDYFEQTNFGQDLDDAAFEKGITGTSVTKITDNFVKGKNLPKRTLVNLLNFYIDPTAKSIQDAYRVMERALMFPDEMAGMKGWHNTTNLSSEEGLSNFDPELKKTTSNAKMRDVWEVWGKIPNSFFTNDPEDQEEVDGHIVVSGIEAGEPQVHLIEKNTTKDKEGNIIKPYEEDWAMKVPGRWYGRGPVEQVMFLQVWINAIVNIRINRAYVAQLGLWKIKRGANITPQTIQKLSSNGAVLVSSMDDIEQMVMQEASQASYSDEANIRDIAKRITRTVETVSGEKLPASTTATSASIQSAASKNPFIKIKERSGFWAERLINRHLLERVIKGTKRGDVIRILNEDEHIDEIIERIAYYYVDKKLDDLAMADLFLDQAQLQIAIQSAKEQLKQRPEIFIENLEELVASSVDTTVYITNEELDMGSTVDKLVMGANLLPEQDRAPIVRTIFDVLGMPYPPEMSFNKAQQALGQGMPQGQPQGLPQEPAINPGQMMV